MAALLEDDHAAAVTRELAREDGAAGARADDHDVDVGEERRGLLAAAEDLHRLVVDRAHDFTTASFQRLRSGPG